jgi:hypothetical protein
LLALRAKLATLRETEAQLLHAIVCDCTNLFFFSKSAARSSNHIFRVLCARASSGIPVTPPSPLNQIDLKIRCTQILEGVRYDFQQVRQMPQ